MSPPITDQDCAAFFSRCLAARVCPVVSEWGRQVGLAYAGTEPSDPERLAELQAWLAQPGARDAYLAWFLAKGKPAEV